MGWRGRFFSKAILQMCSVKWRIPLCFCYLLNLKDLVWLSWRECLLVFPIVAYACPCGPKDLIEDRHNGFLIPMHDEAMFAEKICTLIEDEEMRKRMGHQAWLASQDYQLDKIITRWMRLFEGLRAEKKSC